MAWLACARFVFMADWLAWRNLEFVDVEGRSTCHLEITLPEGTIYVAGVHLGVVCSSPFGLVLGFSNGLFTVLVIILRTKACPHVCGEAHYSGLRDRGADDGVHAQHDSRISAIMKLSWPVSLHGLVTVWFGAQVFLQGSWTIIFTLRGFRAL